MVDRLDIPLHTWNETAIAYDSGGNRIPSQEAQHALDLFWSILADAFACSNDNKHNDVINPNTSLYDFLKQRCQHDFEHDRMDEKTKALVLAISRVWGSSTGDDIERQSLKFFFLEEDMEGGEKDWQFIKTSYRDVMSEIAALPLAKASVRMNTVMKSVRGSSQSVSVETGEGQEEVFDDVVVTCPLGWLQRHRDAISPMPPRLAQAIDSMSYGRLERVYVRFSSVWWQKSTEEPVSFMSWIQPEYAKETNPGSWRIEAVNMAAISDGYPEPILLFWIFGDCSEHLTSSVRSLSTEAQERFLSDFFEPYYSQLPGYDAATCMPLGCLASSWSQDEFAGYGSYCNFQVGAENTAADIECMRHGVPEHHIWLAGEHTAEFVGLGTVYGSYESGEKVADRMLAGNLQLRGLCEPLGKPSTDL